jgi:hypothetical protein
MQLKGIIQSLPLYKTYNYDLTTARVVALTTLLMGK